MNRIYIFIIALFLTVTLSGEEPTHPEVMQRLLSMYKTDQAYRKQMMEERKRFGAGSDQYKKLKRLQAQADAKNIKELVEIIETHGWPTKSMVGTQAVKGAFFVLQHSNPELQEKYLTIVLQAAKNGDLDMKTAALLQDRVLMNQGKKQVYGTQLRSERNGPLFLWPVEDEANLNDRRASIGLEPIEDYLKRWDIEYQPSTQANQAAEAKSANSPVVSPYTSDYKLNE